MAHFESLAQGANKSKHQLEVAESKAEAEFDQESALLTFVPLGCVAECRGPSRQVRDTLSLDVLSLSYPSSNA